MAYTDDTEEFRRFTPEEISKMALWQGRAEDAMAVGDSKYARVACDEMGKIHDHIEKRERESSRSQLMKEVREVMKLPSSQRNEHYAKVKKEKGSRAAVSLVSEVRNQRALHLELEI